MVDPRPLRRAVSGAILLIVAIGVVVAVVERDRFIRWASFD
jgi:hypothetical protein